jgi:hypothetical protein
VNISGGTQATVLHPTTTVIFVPSSAVSITACAQETTATTEIVSHDERQLTVCTVHAPTGGTLRVSGSAELLTSGTTLSADSALRVDRNEVARTAIAGSKLDDGSIVPFGFTHQTVVPLTAGDHDVFFTVAATGPSPVTVFDPSVHAIFTPTASDDLATCSDSTPTGFGTTNSIKVGACTLTLSRAGFAQISAEGRVLKATSDSNYMQAYFWLVVDGVDQSGASGRYMDLRSEWSPAAMTVFTQLGLPNLPAGAHTIELWMKSSTGVGAVNFGDRSLSAVALLRAADAPPDTTAPPTTPPSGPTTTTITPAPGSDKPGPPGPDFVPLVPERVLDTRGPSRIGYVGAKPTAGQTITVQVTGSGASNVPADAKAVVLNLTGTGAVSDGYVTAWPCGSPQPNASNLNVKAGVDVPNLVIAKVGENGTVCLYTQPSQDLIADLAGYMPGDSSYVPVVPDRVLDTRAGEQRGYTGEQPAAGAVIQLDVTGVGSSQLPDDASTVVLNVTGTQAAANGYVTVWPCGAPQPTASNLNLSAAVDRPNLVVSKIGDGGRVCLYTQTSAHLIADINGYLPAGSGYTPILPVRVLETRPPAQIGYSGDKPGPGAIVHLQVTGDGAAPTSATAVALNVTGTEASADGYVTVWPCGSEQPTASNLNLTAGSTAPNLVMAKLGDGGDVCIYTQSGTHLIADLAGYWTN